MSGYTVIDFETTGLFAEGHDRVIEVGVVQVDASGHLEDEWSTLVNPGRDLGAVSVHGIQARDLLDAPRFDDVADHVLRSVAGRTVVAHNAPFDMRFLHRELERSGYLLDVRPAALCSMRWAGALIGPAKLEHCCEAIGIELADAHQALSDARATAGLLAYLVRQAGHRAEWMAEAETSRRFAWPQTRTQSGAPMFVQRSAAPPQPDSWITTVLASVSLPGSPADEASYLLALESALLDRYVSKAEELQLAEVASRSGIAGSRVLELHEGFLTEACVVALQDGVVTTEERADLEDVARCLGLTTSDVDLALKRASGFGRAVEAASESVLRPGDRVVFTGEMRRDRAEWVATIVEAGLTSGGVTKSTRLLVAADPDSLSGKAAKARGYGVAVVGEEAFERLFAAYVAENA